MKMRSYRFTSESVTEGHPDKVADQISDAILDAHLRTDPRARVAVETTVKTNLVVLVGEVTSTSYVDYVGVAKQVLERIGYTDPALGFSVQENMYVVNIQRQSPDIALGVDESLESKAGEMEHELGAGDQGRCSVTLWMKRKTSCPVHRIGARAYKKTCRCTQTEHS